YAVEPGRRVKLLAGSNMAAFAEGFLLAVREGTLMAFPFDAARLQVRGDARAIRFAEQVRYFSVAGNTLAYRAGPDPQFQLTWFDRSGMAQPAMSEPAEEGPVSLSPDGRRVAQVRKTGVWLLDLERNTWMRFTFGDVRAT